MQILSGGFLRSSNNIIPPVENSREAFYRVVFLADPGGVSVEVSYSVLKSIKVGLIRR